MLSMVNTFLSYLNSPSCILTAIYTASAIYLTLSILLLIAYVRYKLETKLAFFVGLIPIGVILCYPLLITKYLIKLNYFTNNIKLFHIARLHGAGYIMQYFAIFGLIQLLLTPSLQFSKKLKNLILGIGLSMIIFFIGTIPFETFKIPNYVIMMPHLYNITIILLLAYQFIQIKRNRESCPKIIRKQIDVIIPLWIAQYVSWDLWCDIKGVITQLGYSNLCQIIPPDSLHLISLTIFTTLIIFAVHRLINLRFLNIKKRVGLTKKVNLEAICAVTEKFANVDSPGNIREIAINFFEKVFNIPEDGVTIHISGDQRTNPFSAKVPFDGAASSVFIKDEMEYNTLHGRTKSEDKPDDTLNMMTSSQASIFIPIHHKNVVIASITIDKTFLKDRLLTTTEHEELRLFAAALATAITTIRYNHVSKLLDKSEKINENLTIKNTKMKREVSKAHYYNDLYKESLATFMRSAHKRNIGIVEYRSRRFMYNNQEGCQLLGFDLNEQKNHPTAESIREIMSKVEHYKTTQSKVILHTKDKGPRDKRDTHLAITIMPITGKQSLLILLYRPDITDLIRKQIKELSNPTDWDYALYMETTKVGHSINQLLPSNEPRIMEIKADLLKATLSRKTIMVKGTGKDLPSVVDLIYKSHLFKHIHTINLTEHETDFSRAIDLFGINNLLLASFDGTNQHEPLLKTLDSCAVIYIKNIEYLSLETQNHLAEYLETNLYTTFKGLTKKSSNVPIVCSTSANCLNLVKNGTFSERLYKQLHVFDLPNISKLPDLELMDLSESIARQLCLDKKVSMFLALSTKDKNVIREQRYESVNELRIHIKKLLLEKSEAYAMDTYVKQTMEESEKLNLSYIATLGKDALKDPVIMEFLWQKFEKQHAKIATFLGVHRSSVHRRCDTYQFN